MDPNTETNIQGNQFYEDTYHSVSKSEVSTVRSTTVLCITKEDKMLMVDIHQLTDNSSISGIRQCWGKGSPVQTGGQEWFPGASDA